MTTASTGLGVPGAGDEAKVEPSPGAAPHDEVVEWSGGFDPFAGVRVEPRPYQVRICTKAVAMLVGEHRGAGGALEPPARSVMIESATGSGKTVMALAVARELQRRRGYRVGWAAMRRNLLAQAAAENAARGFGVELQVISMFDRSPPKVDLLVVDEAQHDAAVSMANLHAAIRPERVVGLTATPYRTDRVALCFDRVIRDASIHQLMADGYLSPYTHYTIPRYGPDEVAATYLREPARWGRSLVFFHQRAECERCCALLRAGGVRAEVVTATSDREAQLSAFEAGEVDVLLSMAILTEGFDCPSLVTVFCRPSGKGCTVQMAGRVFRRHPAIERKQVVQCEQTRHPVVKTATPAEQYAWAGGGWRSLKVNRQIEALSRSMLALIATSPAELPAWVAQRRRPEGVPWARGSDDERQHEA
jgi:superfamily II DNA or RNA helicase